jgi:hypothetical protein
MTGAYDWVEAATRFGVIARRYCALVDTADNLEKDQLLLDLYRILPDLVSEAIRLPDVDLYGRDEPEDLNEGSSAERPSAPMSGVEWRALYELLRKRLGDVDLYWTVFDPTDSKDTEAIRGSLADDVADIYRDLKEVLNLTDKSAISPQEAIWDWRFSFYSHWGHHAFSALRTLHNLSQR